MEWIISLFSHNEVLVWASAFLATFVASVMADEQDARLRNGTFGAVAGSAVGGLAAVITKEQTLLLVGVFGSACGAIAGWAVYLILCWVASTTSGRRLIEYHVSGLHGVRDRLDLDEKERLVRAFANWSSNFSRMIKADANDIAKLSGSLAGEWIHVLIRNWLATSVDVLNLVFDALAEKPQYRSRVTIILFSGEGEARTGKHWLSHTGRLPSYSDAPFTSKSLANKVAMNELKSPLFTNISTASVEGQSREGPTQAGAKTPERSYKSFFLFRLNKDAVMSLDWPSELNEDDPYVRVARDLFQLELVPSLELVLDKAK